MIRQCAWCQRTVDADDEGPAITHTICLRCLPEMMPFAVEDLATLPPNQADQLPYGFIRLDAENRIIGYNAAEAAMSHLHPYDVLGRNFFTDVAPCTNVQELAGWVDEHRRAGVTETKQIQFVFAFPFGRELVELAITYNAEQNQAYILVRARAREHDAARSA